MWQAELDRLTDKEAEELQHDWLFGAREEQRPPEGDWRVWLYLAGRGAGKTRSGAEWVRAQVALGRRRIALVAPTAADARDVIVEGESGILAVSPTLDRPIYEPSKRRLTWPNGAISTYAISRPRLCRNSRRYSAKGRRTLQNLTFAAAIAKRPVSAELTHLALDIFIILLYQYLLQVRQDEHHGLAT